MYGAVNRVSCQANFERLQLLHDRLLDELIAGAVLGLIAQRVGDPELKHGQEIPADVEPAGDTRD